MEAFCFHDLFLYLKFSAILDKLLFYYKFITIYIYQQFVYLVSLEILNTSLFYKWPFIYNILMLYNKILLLILTRNVFLLHLRLIPGNMIDSICPILYFFIPLIILLLVTYFEKYGPFCMQKNQ